jgi:molecular chaperone GrpE
MSKKKIEILGDEDSPELEPKQPAEDEKVEPEKEDVISESADEDIAEQLEASKKENEENYDRFLRVSAEFENYKKRQSREMVEFRKYANQSLIRDILPVIDNLERAISSTEVGTEEGNGILEGIALTFKDLLKILEKYDVQPIDAVGAPFDPNFHQAVSQEASDDYPENTVLHELQKGYLLHDRLVRPSMVIVSTPKSKRDDGENTDDADAS